MGDVIALGQSRLGPSARTGPPPAIERRLLWREAIGHELRRERVDQARTQGDVAERAGISTQYLSEIERGRKDPSSEILAAVTGALHLPLADLVLRAARLLHPAAGRLPGALTSSRENGQSSARPIGPVLLAA